MFAKACAIARQYTFPIIISHKKINGECSAGIGTFVIINEDGWFVTAYHIINQLNVLNKQHVAYRELVKKRQAIEADTTLIRPIKQKQLSDLKIDGQAIENYSVWLGWDGVNIAQMHTLPEVDLAVGRLQNFDKAKVSLYPQFKDPTQPMEQGSSLCKLGFPFHTIKPVYEEGRFVLPPGSLPLPIFPIEGIYTRMVKVKTEGATPFPYMYIETSSPGIMGQSGGPTFDVHGAIWAIQSQTHHLKLGFGDSKKGTKESEYLQHQYLNVGWGIHAETLTGFLKQHNIAYHTSPY